MPLDLPALEQQGVPAEVLNELAILEDRAIRAEYRADRAEHRLAELREDLVGQRDVVDELTAVVRHLRERAHTLEQSAGVEAERCEQALTHAIVITAR